MNFSAILYFLFLVTDAAADYRDKVWKNIRDTYVRAIGGRWKKSGSGTDELPKYQHLDAMSFLKPYVNIRLSTAAAILLSQPANQIQFTRDFLAFWRQIQDGRYLRTFNRRKKEARGIRFYATVEIANVRFFNARFTSVNIYATVEIHLISIVSFRPGKTPVIADFP